MLEPSDQHGGSDGKHRRKAPTSYAQVGIYIGTGFQFAGTMVAGFLGGWWLDGKLSTEPAFLVAGTVLGAVAGFYYLYQTLVKKSPTPGESTDPAESESES